MLLSICSLCRRCFFFYDPAPHEVYTLSLHDALPICVYGDALRERCNELFGDGILSAIDCVAEQLDRKSTRLNSSHGSISYAVFCLKKKKKNSKQTIGYLRVGNERNDYP